jgi:hypothetical protein
MNLPFVMMAANQIQRQANVHYLLIQPFVATAANQILKVDVQHLNILLNAATAPHLGNAVVPSPMMLLFAATAVHRLKANALIANLPFVTTAAQQILRANVKDFRILLFVTTAAQQILKVDVQ